MRCFAVNMLNTVRHEIEPKPQFNFCIYFFLVFMERAEWKM